MRREGVDEVMDAEAFFDYMMRTDERFREEVRQITDRMRRYAEQELYAQNAGEGDEEQWEVFV